MQLVSPSLITAHFRVEADKSFGNPRPMVIYLSTTISTGFWFTLFTHSLDRICTNPIIILADVFPLFTKGFPVHQMQVRIKQTY